MVRIKLDNEMIELVKKIKNHTGLKHNTEAIRFCLNSVATQISWIGDKK